jgi:hypothetical protein
MPVYLIQSEIGIWHLSKWPCQKSPQFLKAEIFILINKMIKSQNYVPYDPWWSFVVHCPQLSHIKMEHIPIADQILFFGRKIMWWLHSLFSSGFDFLFLWDYFLQITHSGQSFDISSGAWRGSKTKLQNLNSITSKMTWWAIKRIVCHLDCYTTKISAHCSSAICMVRSVPQSPMSLFPSHLSACVDRQFGLYTSGFDTSGLTFGPRHFGLQLV